MALNTKLFQPLKVGRVELQHRVVMAPLTRLRADTDHVPLPIAVEYYSQRSSTPGTLIIAEATAPSERHCAAGQFPGIWSKDQVQGWKKITDAIHSKGCSTFLQICPPGRAAAEPFPCVSSSPIPIDEKSRKPREMTDQEIWECIDDMVLASQNAMAAGFDGIELHAANGYLMVSTHRSVSPAPRQISHLEYRINLFKTLAIRGRTLGAAALKIAPDLS